jgi:sugar phosphate isomerase/epimerase
MLLSTISDNNSPEHIAMLAHAGWQAVDIRDLCSHSLYALTPEEQLRQVKSTLDTIAAAGLRVDQCHAPMPHCYASATPEELENIIKEVEQGVTIADRLKIPYTVIHPLVYSWTEDDPDTSRGWELNVRYLSRLCNCAHNTVLCLENMPSVHGFITKGEDMARLLREVGNDSLMVCLDTGHLFSVGGKVSDFFAHVGERIKTLHIHDSVPNRDLHLLPYTGQGDWADFKKTIKAYGYSGNLNSESAFSSRLPASMRLQAEIIERQTIASLNE